DPALPPPPVDPRRPPRPPPPLLVVPPRPSADGVGNQLTLNPISRGISLSPRLSIQAPSSGDAAWAAAGAGVSTSRTATANETTSLAIVLLSSERRHPSYSARSATAGSIVDARRRGAQLGTDAAAISSAADSASTGTSVALTSNSSAASDRPTAIAPARPQTMPIAATPTP